MFKENFERRDLNTSRKDLVGSDNFGDNKEFRKGDRLILEEGRTGK